MRETVDRAAPLNEYAWKFRYPGSPHEPAPEEALETLAAARRILEAMLDRAPSHLRP